MAFNVLLGATLVQLMFFGQGFLDHILIRRALMFPAHITHQYFDFFALNEHIFWSDSKLTLGLTPYLYDHKPAFLIGGWMGNPDMHANSGVLAAGFMHAGMAGVAFYALLTGAIIKVCDLVPLAKASAPFVSAFAMIPLLWLFQSSDLFVSLLTHGLFVTLLLLLFSKESQIYENRHHQA